jgi:hypothetical protein
MTQSTVTDNRYGQTAGPPRETILVERAPTVNLEETGF